MKDRKKEDFRTAKDPRESCGARLSLAIRSALTRATLGKSVATLCALLLVAPDGFSAAALGRVISASNARLGTASLSAGSSIFNGDWIQTESTGNLQIRFPAARLMLTASSSAILGEQDGVPASTLLEGTALFSTANARAFVLKAAGAEIRPRTAEPTIGLVGYVSANELRVQSKRGILCITLASETQCVAEGGIYRVLLNPENPVNARSAATQQGPSQSSGNRQSPRPGGRNKTLELELIATAGIGLLTIFLTHEAWESPDSP